MRFLKHQKGDPSQQRREGEKKSNKNKTAVKQWRFTKQVIQVLCISISCSSTTYETSREQLLFTGKNRTSFRVVSDVRHHLQRRTAGMEQSAAFHPLSGSVHQDVRGSSPPMIQTPYQHGLERHGRGEAGPGATVNQHLLASPFRASSGDSAPRDRQRRAKLSISNENKKSV